MSHQQSVEVTTKINTTTELSHEDSKKPSNFWGGARLQIQVAELLELLVTNLINLLSSLAD